MKTLRGIGAWLLKTLMPILVQEVAEELKKVVEKQAEKK